MASHMLHSQVKFVILIITILFVFEAQGTKFLRGNEKPGECCEIENGVYGRCEQTSSCKKHGGVVRRKNTIKLCAETNDRTTYVCCRRPFEIAKELCNSWRDYWRDNAGKCVSTKLLIAGGEEAMEGQIPEIAILGSKYKRQIKWICGGTLVSPHFVLTAAHCVFRKEDYHLRLGGHNLQIPKRTNISRIIGSVPLGLFQEADLHFEKRNNAPTEQTVRVSRVILHPEYDDRYNDIALLQLERPVVLTKRVLPACLPTNPDEDFMSWNLTVAGWGMLRYHDKNGPSKLHMVNIPVISQRECARDLKDRDSYLVPDGILTRQLCAGAKGKNACKGDSGGPLAVQMQESPKYKLCEHTVAGVVSFGHGCGRLSVYTRVSAYLDWITGFIAPKLIPNLKNAISFEN